MSLLSPPPPRSTLFPYTTLFRSQQHHGWQQRVPVDVVLLEALLDPPVRIMAFGQLQRLPGAMIRTGDRKSTRLNSSHVAISYAVFCLKKKIINAYVPTLTLQQ